MRKVRVIVGLAIMALCLVSSALAAEPEVKVSKYVVDIPKKYYLPYIGPNQDQFPEGIEIGFGSGIHFKSKNMDSSLDFYVISDRGPNGDAPLVDDGVGRHSAKFFLTPSFQPEIGVIRVKDGKAVIVNTIGLKDKSGHAVSGLPVQPGVVGSTDEIALDSGMKKLSYDNNGLDTEGISLDREGHFWVCDEYGPFILEFDRNGKMMAKYAPGDGLPEILKYRVPNRGFEGVTVTPGGLVYGMIQSPLDINGATGKTARFTRLVKIDPKTGQTAMYAYPVDVDAYKNTGAAKLGDLYAISDTKMLLIEQGTGKDKKMRTLIYLVDLSQATDITGVKIDGQEPEYCSDDAKLAKIHFANKKLVCDLRALGWQAEKAEGLAMLPDNKTLVITNDNDFGVSVDVNDSEHPDADIDKYTILADGSFLYKDKPAAPHIAFKSNDEVNHQQYVWLIELPKPIK